ncbi:Do family serine endopeptidase [Phyllobacterium sp. 0TCS1.6C]|uniref:Do family serine endopeptidase n=1 Tax=unclassified Phyllobacterium TaxID=2638441 RepID=UPI002263DF09|nr:MULTISPECIES: Do family serine endopeptidase [unclassified Phyllobacterium]MCX8280614.1 Do family serine endopeptidase [Phyllobacterium sp. 0TCS1.6C]MCX8296459.1 Do family serine endopeptidase [Phyllobacterium sp. 0TCS1.6A]
MSNKPKSSNYRRGIAAALLSSALVGGFLATGPLSAIAPAQAEAVRVESNTQQPGFADVVEKVSPAVVSVRVKSAVKETANNGSGFPGFDQLPDDHPLKRFFYDFGGPDQYGRRDMEPRKSPRNKPDRVRPAAQGSGFFISEDGYLVTNNHVVEDGSAYTVVLDDGTELDAKLIGKDKRTDLAVLKVDDKRKFTYVAFGDDNKVRVGEWVVAVGNPFGLGGTVTAGIVSARGRDIGAGPYDDFLQIDAAVNRGNSGGPAFNLNGEVVGINTAIFSPSGGSVGIAFAIPAQTAKDVVDQLIKTGTVSRGWIGVQIQPVSKEIAESLGLSEDKGALVVEPQPDGPAAKAGIAAGDVITAVNGEKVNDSRDLAKKVAAISAGQTAELTVWQKGEAKAVKVDIKPFPGDEQLAAASPKPGDEGKSSALEDYGLTVMPSDDGQGVVVTDVDRQGDAADKGITTGDVIVSVNNRPVKSGSDIDAAVTEAGKAGRKAVLLQVQRQDQSRFVALPINQG